MSGQASAKSESDRYSGDTRGLAEATTYLIIIYRLSRWRRCYCSHTSTLDYNTQEISKIPALSVRGYGLHASSSCGAFFVLIQKRYCWAMITQHILFTPSSGKFLADSSSHTSRWKHPLLCHLLTRHSLSRIFRFLTSQSRRSRPRQYSY